MRHSLVAVIGITLSLCAAIVGCTSTQTATTLAAPSIVKCQVQVSASTTSFSENGGTGSLTVDTTRDCAWSTNVSANWVTVANSSGQGGSTVSYSVAPNTVPQARSTSISVGDQAVQLVQAAAPCRYALNSSAAHVGYGGGSLAVTLQTLSGCGWTTSSDSGWLMVTTGASGNTSATIGFSVSANAGAVRVGHALVGGQSFLVTQDAAPAATPPPSPSPSPAPPAVSDPGHGATDPNGNGNGDKNGGNDKGKDNGNGKGKGK
jgi:Putative binding domain, N-terminal/Viral BACON domain